MKILIILLILTSTLYGATFKTYPHDFKEPVKKLLLFPKANELLEQVQKQGRVSVKSRPFSFSTSNAMWQSQSRTITLNSERERSEGEIIRSILFELHNAKHQSQFRKIDTLAKKRWIDKRTYVKEIERIEHKGALETHALLNEGINLGYYPRSAYWPIYQNFETHYALQQKVGHSQFIGKMYDKITT